MHIPDKQTPNDVANKLLISTAKGDVYSIKNSIHENKSFLSVSDENNRTILHHILLNSNIPSSSRFDLVKYAIDNGAPVDLADSNGVRPLHLACNIRDQNIISYLLQKKADPNSRDNSHFSPLHHLVSPVLFDKPSKPKEIITTPEKPTPSINNDAYDELFNDFSNNNDIKQFITHIANIFNYAFIFSDNSDNQDRKFIYDYIQSRPEFKELKGGADFSNLPDSFRTKLIDLKKIISDRFKTKISHFVPLQTGDTPDDTARQRSSLTDNKTGLGPKNLHILSAPSMEKVFEEYFKSYSQKFETDRKNMIENNNEIHEKALDIITNLDNILNILGVMNNVSKIIDVLDKTEQHNDLKNLIGETFYNMRADTYITKQKCPQLNIYDRKDLEDIDTEKKCDNQHEKDQFQRLCDGFEDNDIEFMVYNMKNIYKRILDLAGELHSQDNSPIRLAGNNNITYEKLKGLDLDTVTENIDSIGKTQLSLINMSYCLHFLSEYIKRVYKHLNIFKYELDQKSLTDTFDNIYELIYNLHQGDKKEADFNKGGLTRIRNIDAKIINKYFEKAVLPLPSGGNRNERLYYANYAYAKYDNNFFRGFADNNGENNLLVINNIYDPNIGNSPINFNTTGYFIDTPCIVDANGNFVLRSDGTTQCPPPTGVIYYKYDKVVELISITNLGLDEDGNPKLPSHLLSDLLNNIKYDERDSSFANNFIYKFYEAICDLQSSINVYIDNFNLVNSLRYIYLFNQSFTNSYNYNQTSPYTNILKTSLKKLNTFPKSFVSFFDPFITDLNNDDKSRPVSNIIKLYGYNLDTNQDLVIIGNNNPQNGNPGILGLEQNSHLVNKGEYQIINQLNATQIQDRNITIDFTILRHALDMHLDIIKTVCIFRYVDRLNVNTKPNLKKLYDNISSITLDNNNAFYLMVIKLLDEIFIESVNTMISSGINNYIISLLPQNAITTIIRNTNPNPNINLNPNLRPANLPRPVNIPRRPISNLRGGADITPTITRPPNRSISRDNEYLKNLIKEYSYTNPNSGILQFYGELHDLPNNNEQKAINYESPDRNADKYYKSNDDMIGLLLSYGADPNIIEKSGFTPLFYAVKQKNIVLVDSLLRSGSKMTLTNDPSKNIYLHAWKDLMQVINSSPYNNITSINDNLKKHVLQKTNKSVIYSNSDLILPIAMYLFNHQLTVNTLMNPNMWNNTLTESLLNIVGLDIENRLNLPLNNVNNPTEHKNNTELIDRLYNEINKKQEVLSRLRNSLNNLNEFNSQPEYKELYDETKNSIDTLTQEINRKNAELGRLISGNAPSVINNTEYKYVIKRNICNIYNDYYDKKLNNNDIVYQKLWRKLLFNSDLTSDHTQLPYVLQDYIKDNYDRNNAPIEPDIFINNYESIYEFYSKILNKYGRDYFELSSYLNKSTTTDYDYNYVLNQIFCIIKHVFQHIISYNLIASVVQSIARYDRSTNQDNKLMNIYNSLETTGFIDLCYDTLPIQIIKIVCKMPEGENDPDMKLSTIDVLNNTIDHLSRVSNINIDSSFVKNLKDDFSPFFNDYMCAYTAEMHSIIIRQLKNFMEQHKSFEIIKLLCERLT